MVHHVPSSERQVPSCWSSTPYMTLNSLSRTSTARTTATDVDARYLRKEGHPTNGLSDAIARDKLSSLPRHKRAEEWLESAYLPCITHLVKNTYHQWAEWTLPPLIITVSLSVGIVKVKIESCRHVRSPSEAEHNNEVVS